MIIHKKHKINFTQIANELLNNPKLSWKAKGILCYLLSKPEGWHVQVADILKHGSDGEASIRAALRECRELHYARLETIRERGKITDRRLTIDEFGNLPDDMLLDSETPDRENHGDLASSPREPHGDFLNMENLNEENLNEENRDLRKTDKSNTDKSNKEKKGKSSLDFLDEELQAEWEAWQENRRQQGNPITQIARGRQVQFLAKLGKDRALASLRQSIEKGWAGLYEPKAEAKPRLPIKTRDQIINSLNEKKQQLIRANAPYWKIHEIDMRLQDL